MNKITDLPKIDFEALLAHQRHAPFGNVRIETLCRRPKLGEREFPDQLVLDHELGVIGDRWKDINWVKKPDGSSDPRNQISILPKRIYEGLCLVRSDFYPGDTIIADIETSFENYPTGTRLKLGDAILEVSDVDNYGCEKWRERYGLDTWKFIAHKNYQRFRLRGFLCQIVKSGTISRGDLVESM